MSQNEQPNKLPLQLSLLDDNKKIVDLNKEHPTILDHIIKELEADKYNSVVTMENYPSMKASATELNKTAEFINRFKIDKVKLETKDIETFKTNCKTYIEPILAKRESIKKGLEVFEEETKKQVIKVCKEYAEARTIELELREEFRDIDVYAMTQTKYMTAKGAISKAGKDEIEKRLNEQLNQQSKVDNRILSLENECLKAGIQPLTVEHIQGFLYSDDATYSEKLQSLINAEIKRNEQIKAQEKIKAEKEAKDKVLREQQSLKAELEARYLGQISTADLPNLTRINLELQSYDANATYELKQKCNDRQRELETQSQTKHEVDETPKEQHIQDIAKEPVKEVVQEKPKAVNGKVEKTLSIKIRVPENATDEQVIGAVINMIKADRFPVDNIEVK